MLKLFRSIALFVCVFQFIGATSRMISAADEHFDAAHFDLDALAKPPVVFPASDYPAKGVKSLFFQGVSYQGQPTRVFAYYGLPADEDGQLAKKHPAIVLIHGGGGTAFDRWVALWNSRGYAAISMDLCGSVPVGAAGSWKRHEHGGPMGWDASFGQLHEPVEDQWTYHAISAVMLAHSLLRSFPEVDADRIGVTGISWGGYLACIVAGVDPRLKFAVPVYGCGFLGDNSAWLPAFDNLGTEQTNLWLRRWDPSVYLRRASMPMLWVNGTNDFAYPMDSWQKSYQLPTGRRDLCLRVRMPHNHSPDGEGATEILVFANSILGRGQPLAKITGQGQSENTIWATFQSEITIVKAELNFTLDTGKWQDRKWETVPATIERASNRVTAEIPLGAKVVFLNLIDDRMCIVSSPHIER